MSKIVTCKECGIEYYSETIVPRMSFRHVYPDIVKLETELAEARAEIERLRQELRDNSTLAARQIVPAEMLVDDLTAEIERKDKLIEQMKADLQRAKENFETMDKILTTQCAPMSVAKAAYNTGMSYLNDALVAERTNE